MMRTFRPARSRRSTTLVAALASGALVSGALYSNIDKPFVSPLGVASAAEDDSAPALNPTAPDRLPDFVDGRPVAPDLGCFWSFGLDGDEYKKQIDAVSPTGAFDVWTLTVRNYNSPLGNDKLVETTKKAVEYARDAFGLKTILDVDLRIARYDFEKERPDLRQERLFLQDAAPADATENAVLFAFECPNLSDHYTGNLPYYVRGGRLVKAWAYKTNADGEIDPASIRDVSDKAVWDKTETPLQTSDDPSFVDPTSRNQFAVSFEKSAFEPGERVAAAVAFRYSYPDLFADETLELERRMYETFRDVPAIGVAKDEWGFPPHFDREDNLNDYWYSERTRAAYNAKNAGRDLVDDLFLAFRPQAGKADERVAAVDSFRRLCAERVVEYEFQNYRLTKETWGPNAFVGVHCTWYPWPNVLEMRKDGLDWWKAPRDFGQTDEYAPFCCRNALAKATDSLWINMFYARQVPPYIWEHWTAAASGGRVHIHQIYPSDENSPKNPLDVKHLPIVGDGGAAKIRQKIRVLNLVSNAPLDAPVAVVFGRIGASNPLRPEYKAVGVDVCDRFSTAGFPADLIPSDEVFSTNVKTGAPQWTKSADGYLKYGPQKYYSIVLYGESAADADSFAALKKLAGNDCKTEFIDLPATATDDAKTATVEKTLARLNARAVAPQTNWVRDNYSFSGNEEISARPPRTTFSRFVDGSLLWIAADKSDFGDPISLDGVKVRLDGDRETQPISVEANGVFSVRFADDGTTLDAVAAAELKSLKIGDFELALRDEEIDGDPIDVAIWRDSQTGELRGVFQRAKNALPESLKRAVPNWTYLRRR